MTLAVLFEDAWTLVVAKPAGMLVHNSAYAGPKEHTLAQEVPEGVHPLSRLDRPTSGLVLYGKGPEAVTAWQTALALESCTKTYLALARGQLLAGSLVDHALKDERGIVQEAQSRVEPLANSPVARCCLVRVDLLTGRLHQVRRHLQHLSHPILGDTTYGHGKDNRPYREEWGLHRLGLHAWRLSVDHPFSGDRLVVEAPLPADLWDVLARLFPEDTLPSLGLRPAAG